VSVVQVTSFRLAAGADESDFLAADRRVQVELVPNQPGFQRRTTARRGGDWLVVTLWGSEPDAAAFEELTQGDPVQVGFEAHIEPGSIATARYDTLD
jgi:heme-degrading monooxygenase HmoA